MCDNAAIKRCPVQSKEEEGLVVVHEMDNFVSPSRWLRLGVGLVAFGEGVVGCGIDAFYAATGDSD